MHLAGIALGKGLLDLYSMAIFGLCSWPSHVGSRASPAGIAGRCRVDRRGWYRAGSVVVVLSPTTDERGGPSSRQIRV